MPIYNYRCIQCRQPDQRIAWLDDSMAVCRGVMLREDTDIFKPYFEAPAPDKKVGEGE